MKKTKPRFYYMARFGNMVYTHNAVRPRYYATTRQSNKLNDPEFVDYTEWNNLDNDIEFVPAIRITRKCYDFINGSHQEKLIAMNMFFNSGAQGILENPARTIKPRYYLAHWPMIDDLIVVRHITARTCKYAVLDQFGNVSFFARAKPSPTTVPARRITKEVLDELISVRLDARMAQLAILASHNLLLTNQEEHQEPV